MRATGLSNDTTLLLGLEGLAAQRVEVDDSGAAVVSPEHMRRRRGEVVDWLGARGKAWCEQVRYVAIDMCSVFAAGIALALPHATIVVDHFHVVQLANQALHEIRCRITTQLRARRGRKGDGEWDVRNLLPRNRENLSQRRFARMWNTLIDLGEPGEDILAAYIAKENLRELLALAPHRLRPPPHLRAAVRLLRLVHPRRHPRTRTPRRHHRTLVASHRSIHQNQNHERDARGSQPRRQARRPQRLRIPQPHQPTPTNTLRHYPPSPWPSQARLTSKSRFPQPDGWRVPPRP